LKNENKEKIEKLENENKELKKELKNEKKNNENLEKFKKEIEFFSTKFDENIKSKYENCNNIFKEE
jgi:predicted RNase H-like nuclease (RuvC/YqgF family)